MYNIYTCLPDTKVYLLDISCLQDAQFFQQVYEQVSAQRRTKVDAMRFVKGKCLSLGVEYLLMQACSDFGVDYAKQIVEMNEWGKPGFAGCPIHYNLSHSGERVMCIMSKYEVGCDVERSCPQQLDIGERFFAAQEIQLLRQCGSDEERERLFFKLWTLKESFMKCVGRGFGLALKDFTILFNRDKITVQQYLDAGNYDLFSRKYGGYFYAWCIKNEKILQKLQ